MKKIISLIITGIFIAFPALSLALDYQLRHDPFVKHEAASASNNRAYVNGPVLELKAVILDGAQSMANINGKFVKVNQSVAGQTVTAIERNRVILSRNGNSIILNAKEK